MCISKQFALLHYKFFPSLRTFDKVSYKIGLRTWLLLGSSQGKGVCSIMESTSGQKWMKSSVTNSKEVRILQKKEPGARNDHPFISEKFSEVSQGHWALQPNSILIFRSRITSADMCMYKTLTSGSIPNEDWTLWGGNRKFRLMIWEGLWAFQEMGMTV